MCPARNRVAEEIEALASDRLIAARGQPDEAERRLLGCEARLLHMAADAALTHPTDAWMVQSAFRGAVVHCELFVMWGISRQAEDHLRALAARAAADGQEPGDAGQAPDPLDVFRAVLGVSLDPAGGHVPHACAPAPQTAWLTCLHRFRTHPADRWPVRER